MSTPISFFVAGLPAPGGSKRGFIIRRKTGKLGVAMADMGGERNVNWKQAVATCAAKAMAGRAMFSPGEPLSLRVEFHMPRPKSHFKKNGELKPNAPFRHTNQPDATKLLRSTEDAMKGIVWADDSAVSNQIVDKAYLEPCGAKIRVEVIAPFNFRLVDP